MKRYVKACNTSRERNSMYSFYNCNNSIEEWQARVVNGCKKVK